MHIRSRVVAHGTPDKFQVICNTGRNVVWFFLLFHECARSEKQFTRIFSISFFFSSFSIAAITENEIINNNIKWKKTTTFKWDGCKWARCSHTLVSLVYFNFSLSFRANGKRNFIQRAPNPWLLFRFFFSQDVIECWTISNECWTKTSPSKASPEFWTYNLISYYYRWFWAIWIHWIKFTSFYVLNTSRDSDGIYGFPHHFHTYINRTAKTKPKCMHLFRLDIAMNINPDIKPY